ATSGYYLRSAINPAKYHPVDELKEPSSSPFGHTASLEVHDLSLPYTAALYDTLVDVYEAERESGKSPSDALKAARDRIGYVWGGSQKYLNHKNVTFANGLSALLKANDAMHGG